MTGNMREDLARVTVEALVRAGLLSPHVAAQARVVVLREWAGGES